MVIADTISKYNQFKKDFDNNGFNQNFTNIQSDDLFTRGLREDNRSIRQSIRSTTGKIRSRIRKLIPQCMIAIILESKLLDNKEQARLEMRHQFNQEKIMKVIMEMNQATPTAPKETL